MAGVATLTYLPGAIIALVVVGRAWSTDGCRVAGKTIGVGLGTGVVLLIPIAAIGGLPAMFTQIIIAPIVASTTRTIGFQLQIMVAAMGFGVVGIVVGGLGWITAVASREHLWLTVGALGMLGRGLLLDLEAATDLLGLMLFVALGVGFLIASIPESRQLYLGGGIAILIIAAGVSSLLIPYPQVSADNHVFDRSETDVPPMETIYWEKIEPDRCHYRLSTKEQLWIQLTDASLSERHCRAYWSI